MRKKYGFALKKNLNQKKEHQLKGQDMEGPNVTSPTPLFPICLN